MKTFGRMSDLCASAQPATWPRRPCALVVDDDSDIRQLLQLALGTFFGCEVELAHSATEAIRKLDQRDFSFVVCDLMLGAESGMEVFRFLRNHPERSAPFILFSGNASKLLPFERDQFVTVEKTDLNHLLDVIEDMGFPPA